MKNARSRIFEKDPFANWHDNAVVDGEVMDGQLGRVESDIEYIKRNVAELKTDIRELRAESKANIAEVRKAQERDFRLLFSVIIAVALGTATLLAKTMGWIQ